MHTLGGVREVPVQDRGAWGLDGRWQPTGLPSVPSATGALAGGPGDSLDAEESFGGGLSQQSVRI